MSEIAYPKTAHHPVAQERRWRRRWVRIASEHAIAESVRSHALWALFRPMAAPTAAVALLGVTHSRALPYATRRYLHLHRLAIHQRPVQLFDSFIHVARRFEVHEPVVSHDVAFHNGAELFEQLAYLRRFRVISQIADEDLCCRRCRRLATLRGLALHGLVVQHVAVQILYGLAPFRFVLHVNEPVILHDIALYDFSVFFEQGPYIVDRRFLGEVSDKDFERSRTAKTRHGFA